jgi:anti-sigma-K factor RskA
MNMPAPNDPELDALLGAYALDALEPDERARVDAYIAENARARDEVDELRESAASLALAPIDDTTAPAELWDRLSRAIDGELASRSDDDTADDELVARRARRSARGVRWMSLGAAAAALAAAVLAVQVISLHHRLDDARVTGAKDAAASFARAGRVVGARTAALVPSNGAEVARVVLLPDGSGYLKNDGLAPLDADHTYQLWALTGSPDHPVAISAGVLGPDPSAAAFQVSTDVRGVAITIERAGGVPQTTQKPYASAMLT